VKAVRLGAWLARALGAGRGRPAALALLVLAAALHLPRDSPLEAARLAFFDACQVWLPRDRVSGPVTIVAIDEASLKAYGQWPWPRNQLAALIERIAQERPAAIGLDIIMPEPDATSPEALARTLSPLQEDLKQALAALPPRDGVLAAAVRAAPVVLGAAGFDAATSATARGLRVRQMAVVGADPLPYVRRYPLVLASLPELQAAARGQALLSADTERGIVRRVPLVAAIGDTLVPTLSLELLRVGIGEEAVRIETGAHGVTAVAVGEVRVPTQTTGEAWVHFSRFMRERYVSALDVMRGRLEPDVLASKLAIVALTGIGLMDYKTTPRGEYVPGAEYHAQLIESFFDGHFLLRPHWMHWAELAVQLGSGAFLILALPALRPRHATLLAVGVFVLVYAAGFASFRWGGLLFDAVSVSVGVTAVFAALIASAFIEADRGRREAQRALQVEREASARVAGELEAARRIQLGILPRADTAFPGEQRFELASALEPARAVGGDLYDFFRLDERRVFLLIGDVSGKGVPASLFMSIAKALAKSIALRQRLELKAVLTQANVEIARDNPEAQFVTMFAAVLDADSGTMEYWNAGHDAPVLRSAGLASLESAAGGPPLCVLDEFEYGSDTVELARRDAVVMFTDGVTEAANAAGELYGRKRLEALLARVPREASADDLLREILADLRAFVGAAEPSDDVTLLVVRWLGPAQP
jgi:serine phosphatase RsbU (regulator of sigma subunit)/CHASE2 domain-containing sensor protein